MLYDAALSDPKAGIARYWVEDEGGGVKLVMQQDVGGNA